MLKIKSQFAESVTSITKREKYTNQGRSLTLSALHDTQTRAAVSLKISILKLPRYQF